MKTKTIIYLFLPFIILLSSGNLIGQEISNKVAAIYLYSFSKYIDWPAREGKNKFVIGVYGESPIIEELKTLTLNKMVDDLPIQINVIKETNEVEKCNILYVPSDKKNYLDELAKLATQYKVLLVTQGKDLAKQGAGINLVTLNGVQKFELNERLIKKAGLKVRSELFPLAINIK